MTEFTQDLRYAVRSWWRSPAVLLTAILSLGLGIGAATTIFTVVDGLLFAPTHGLEPRERLVRIYTARPDGESLYGPSSHPDSLDLARSLDAVDAITVSRPEPVIFGEDSAGQVVQGEKVGWNYFRLLGIRPALGRVFSPADAEGDAEHLAVLSHRLWTRELGADPDVVGRIVRIGAVPHEVVGVAPETLEMGNPLRTTDVWIPLRPGNRPPELAEERAVRRFEIHGRLAPDATLEQLRAQLEVAAARFHRDHGRSFETRTGEALRFEALSEDDARIPPDRQAILLVVSLFPLLIAGLVLLIASSNVATLFLARAETRRRETALRLALGAPRLRLASLYLAESLVPALGSAAVGLGLAWALLQLLATVRLPVAVPVSLAFELDPAVILFALVLSIGVALLFGLLPSLAGSRLDLVRTLRSSTAGAGGGSGAGRWRRVLVVVQVAASLVLITGSGLFYRGARSAARIELGFEPEGIALTSKTLPADLASAREAGSRIDELLERLRRQPEIVEAHASTAVEMSMVGFDETPVSATGLAAAAERPLSAFRNDVTPGYLEMMGLRLVAGRTFRVSDGSDAPPVAVVNDVFASRLWPSGPALGATFEAAVPAVHGQTENRRFTVVGVVGDGKFMDIDDPPLPTFWTSLSQGGPPSRVLLVARGRAGADALLPILRREVPRGEAEVTLLPPTTLASSVALQFLFGRIVVDVLGWGGAFGLFLAAIGLSGIVAFSVACRRREIAIRVALGAGRGQIVRDIAREGVRLALVGAGVGLLAVVPLAHLLRAQLFGISPADPLALSTTVVALLAVAVVASILPARRALAVDPVHALRAE